MIESLLQGNWGLVYIVIVEHGCSDAIANSPIIIAEMSDKFQKKPTHDYEVRAADGATGSAVDRPRRVAGDGSRRLEL